MPRTSSPLEFNSFSKGLITDASPLNMIPDSAIEMVNMNLFKDGSVHRRLGMAKIDVHQTYFGEGDINQYYDTFETLRNTDLKVLNIELWEGVGDRGDVNLLILFMNDDFGSTIVGKIKLAVYKVTSSGLVPVQDQPNISLPYDTFVRSPAKQFGKKMLLAGAPSSVSGGLVKDYLSVLEYDESTDSVDLVHSTNLRVRDFWGLKAIDPTSGDDLTEGQNLHIRPSVTPPFDDNDKMYLYNLRNQGFGRACLAEGGSTKIDPVGYYQGLTESGGKVPALADKFNNFYYANAAEPTYPTADRFHGIVMSQEIPTNDRAPMGSAIIRLFDRQESRKDFLDKIFDESISGSWYGSPTSSPFPSDKAISGERVGIMEYYAGRMWYGGFLGDLTGPQADFDGAPKLENTIFFSQLIRRDSDVGKCYQEGDPTGVSNPDLVATDGGFIPINEARNLTELKAYKDSLLIFSDQGVWAVRPVSDSGFTATSYQVVKITSKPAPYQGSIVDTGDTILFLNNEGVNAIQYNQLGDLEHVLISEDILDDYFSNISPLDLSNAKGDSSRVNRKVEWVIPEVESTRILSLDLTLGAYTQKVVEGNLTQNEVQVLSVVALPPDAIGSIEEQVVVGVDDVIVAGDPVIISSQVPGASDIDFLYLIGQTYQTGFASRIQYGFATESDQTFTDWAIFPYATFGGTDPVWTAPTPTDAEGYFVTSYLTGGDTLRNKQVPYLVTLLNKTESGFVDVGGDLQPVNPSSCLVQARWNWTNSDRSGKWGREFQAYRHRRFYMPTGSGDGFDDGNSVVTTKNKLRGGGKSLSLRMKTEPLKDFQVLGWSMVMGVNSNV